MSQERFPELTDFEWKYFDRGTSECTSNCVEPSFLHYINELTRSCGTHMAAGECHPADRMMLQYVHYNWRAWQLENHYDDPSLNIDSLIKIKRDYQEKKRN